MMTLSPLDFKAAMNVFADNPGMFGIEALGSVGRTDYQQDGIETMLQNDYVAIKSANAMGKTFTISDGILEALYVHGYVNGGEIYIICTAPDFNIIKNVLFSEIRKKHGNAKIHLGGQCNLTEIKLQDKWHLLGFSPRKSAGGDASNFQGFHAAEVIIVLEEATGVPKSIWDMAGAMTTTGKVRIWAIGNPTDGNSEFARKFKSPLWITKTWSCFMSPNLIANDIKKLDDINREMGKIKSMKTDAERRDYLKAYKCPRPELLTARSVIEQAMEYGVESPLFQGRVLAQFPDAAINTLLPVWRVEECMTHAARDDDEKKVKLKKHSAYSIGVDVARYGDDTTEITVFKGNEKIYTRTITQQDTVYVYNAVRPLALEYLDKPADVIITVDVTGIGSGVFDDLVNDPILSGNNRCYLYQANFGAAALESEKYVNLISEAAAYTRDMVLSGSGLLLTEDMQLLNELTNRRYKYSTDARFMLEPKDDYKRRNAGKSPDKADSVMLSCYGYKLYDYLGAPANAYSNDNKHNAVAYKNAGW